MDKEKITADYIISVLKERVESKQVQFDANFFVETALKLNLLLGDEQDKLADFAFKVAELRKMLFDGQEKKNVSETKILIEADPVYLEFKKQEMKCKRIEEFIRIAKRMSATANGM